MSEIIGEANNWVNWLISFAKLLVEVGTVLIAIKGWVLKPVKKMSEEVGSVKESIEKKLEEQDAKIKDMKSDLSDIKTTVNKKLEDNDTRLGEFIESQKTLMHDQLERQMNQEHILSFLVSDRLSTAKDYWRRQGYCPEPDRSRLLDMYKAHKENHQNHLADSFVDDIKKLPKYGKNEEV